MTNQTMTQPQDLPLENNAPITTEAEADATLAALFGAPDAAGPSPAPAAPADMAATITRLNEELAAAKDEFLRAMADADNIRRRAAEDVQKAHKFGIEKFAKDLLGVKDSLDAGLAADNAAIETLKSGMEITQRQLAGVMERFAVVEIPAVGQRFDPNRHQAIAQVESDLEPNVIVSCLQKGYLLHERVLRPSLVTVAKPKTVTPSTAADHSA